MGTHSKTQRVNRIVSELSDERTRERMVRVATKVLRNPAEAEDAAHDAIIQALRAAEGFRADAQVTTWLHRVAVNAALMRIRGSKRHARRVNDLQAQSASASDDAVQSPSPAQLNEAHEERVMVRDAVATLAPAYRDVLQMCIFDEVPLDQAARTLGLTTSAVRTRIGRARAQLKDRLGDVLLAA